MQRSGSDDPGCYGAHESAATAGKQGAIRILMLLVTLGASEHAIAQANDPVVHLTRLGGMRISAVYDLDAAPPYAYALERENLRVLDVRDPRAVREVANLEFTGPRLWSVVHGSGLYLGGFTRPLAVIDVSQPLRPRWLGPHPDLPHPLSVQIVEDHLYVVEAGPPLSLAVMQLRKTAGFPQRLATIAVELEQGQRFSGFCHDAGRLYLLLERQRSSGSQLAIINIKEPAQPRYERRIVLPELWDYRKVAVRGDLVYATMANEDLEFGLAVFRLGAAEATMLGSVTDPRLQNGGRMLVNGHAIYATYKDPAILATFDVSDPDTPKLAQAFIPLDQTASGLGFSRVGDRLYVSGDGGASVILDISSPLVPRYIGSWNYSGGWASAVSLAGTRAVVLNWTHGLFIYDVADPASPTLLGSYQTPNGDVEDDLMCEGDLVLLSHGSRPTELVDISDPASPTLVTTYSVPGTVIAGVLEFPRAIQAYRDGGLGIVDVTRSDAQHGYLEIEGIITDLEVHEGLAVVAHPDGGVSVIDIADPKQPEFVGRAAPQASEGDDNDDMLTRLALAPDGARAFTLRGYEESEDGTVTVSVFDIRPASSIRRLGTVNVQFVGWAQDYTILGGEDEILIAVGSDVVRIDVSESGKPTARTRYRTSANIEGLARQGQLIVVAASEDGVQLFELPFR